MAGGQQLCDDVHEQPFRAVQGGGGVAGFFNDILYDQMQGIDEIHPLNGLHKASVMLGTKTFSMSDYAGIMKKADRPVEEAGYFSFV